MLRTPTVLKSPREEAVRKRREVIALERRTKSPVDSRRGHGGSAMTTMDALLDCYFDSVVAGLDRSSLMLRRRRLQLVDFLSNAARGWCLAEGVSDPGFAVAAAVRRALRYHSDARASNGGVCRSGKYHDVLYVAAKLCVDWELRDHKVVAEVLVAVHGCERSFERLLAGALLGGKAAQLVSGWRGDSATPEESVAAAAYLFDAAARARLEHGEVRARTVDVPVDPYSGAAPARLALQLANLPMLELLLRHGARVSAPDLGPLLARISESSGGASSCRDLACLRLALRALPGLEPCLAPQGLVPPGRCGLAPPELKHLCRCAVREALWRGFQLPRGIALLPLPASLRDYLDLRQD
ncbi:uncharacterized protein LOC134534554 [Bacillus rossius redtenbacheri]|uniref:uncharacterized protein LOC134534554 n=1 Tax=Bacillus rossius redtenbacheri TaxID=93214 RepID=UPI002FDE3A9F